MKEVGLIFKVFAADFNFFVLDLYLFISMTR